MTGDTYEFNLRITETPSLCLNRQRMGRFSWLLQTLPGPESRTVPLFGTPRRMEMSFGSSYNQTEMRSPVGAWCSCWTPLNRTQMLLCNSPRMPVHSFDRQNVLLAHTPSRDTLRHVPPSVTHCTWISASTRDIYHCGCWSSNPNKHKGWNLSHENKTVKDCFQSWLFQLAHVASVTIITTTGLINGSKSCGSHQYSFEIGSHL